MRPESAETALRATLFAVGAVATATGAAVALRGTVAVPGGAPTVPSNESVLRFYAVWWAAQGPAAWRLARDPDLSRRELSLLAGLTFAGGLARVGAVRVSGRPHPLFQALTVLELLAPPALLGLRRQIANTSPN